MSWGVPSMCLAKVPPSCCALLGRPFLPEADSEQILQFPKACRVAKRAFLNIHCCDQMNRTSRAI